MRTVNLCMHAIAKDIDDPNSVLVANGRDIVAIILVACADK